MATPAQFAATLDSLAAAMPAVGIRAAHDIGGYGRKVYLDTARASGLLPGTLAATHGRIRGRNRPASVGYRIHDDDGHQAVTVTPRGDLWWVRAQGRDAKGSHAALRYGKNGRSRRTKVRRGTPPLAPAPQLYDPPRDQVTRAAPRLVDAAVAAQLGKVFRG